MSESSFSFFMVLLSLAHLLRYENDAKDFCPHSTRSFMQISRREIQGLILLSRARRIPVKGSDARLGTMEKTASCVSAMERKKRDGDQIRQCRVVLRVHGSPATSRFLHLSPDQFLCSFPTLQHHHVNHQPSRCRPIHSQTPTGMS